MRAGLHSKGEGNPVIWISRDGKTVAAFSFEEEYMVGICTKPNEIRSAVRLSSIVWFLMLLVAGSALAQTSTGNIYGTVTGNDGTPLPGVTVTLSGVGAPLDTITDAQGRFRFPSLSPGSYSLKAELAGYGSAMRGGVTVNIGRNADVAMALNPSVSETITVTAEAPLLDVRRTGTGATVTKAELDEVPTARDPWVIMQQVPGVLIDRINIGGNESGQQSSMVSKGVTTDQVTYSVDGVNTTDMVATGASPDYFDFSSFEEVQVSTGGTDPRVQTPGAQLNIVTKRGTNDFSGSARYFVTPGDTQGERKIPSEAQGYIGKTNEINEVTDWGGEVGGPIVRDRLWLWGAYAYNTIDLFTAQPKNATVRYSDNTVLETINLKANAQITQNNSATAFWYNNSKSKIGRNAGPLRPPETTWNQDDFGPAGTYKVEDTHIFSPNFYLTGLYSHVNGGFGIWANSGAGCQDMDCVANSGRATVFSVAEGHYRNTFYSAQGKRPQDQTRLDGSSFFNTGAMSHELKFGFGYRNAGAEGLSLWPSNQYIIDLTGTEGAPDGFGLTYFFAIGSYKYEYEYNDLYVGDTMLWGNLTLQAGARFDRQKAMAGDQSSPANPFGNDPFCGRGDVTGATPCQLLPAVTAKGSDIDTMEWESISPRIGLTYAFGADKSTLVRAAYNSYVAQLGSNSSGYAGVVPAFYRNITYYTLDANGNDHIEPGEVLYAYGFAGAPGGFDPNNPTNSTFATRRVDQDVKPQTTDEWILGVEHELMRDFVVGLNYTHRDITDFVVSRFEKHRGQGDYYTSADYELAYRLTGSTPETGSYDAPVYQLKSGVAPPVFGVLTNRPDYSQTYDGLELSLVKRMNNRWMLRGNVSYSDWVQNLGADAIVDPTHVRTGSGCSSCDEAAVVQGSGTISGAKGAVWINSKWAVNAAGVYQIPVIETNLGFNFTMRQGYPALYAASASTSSGEGRKNVLLDDVDAHRLPNPYSLDLRLAKDVRFHGMGLEFSLDAFNVTNEQTILQRTSDLIRTPNFAGGVANNAPRGDTANRVRELQNPRVLRLGARFTF